MPRYFLDTSALAKLYHGEAGSEYVRRILADPACRSLISRLSFVEMESVFAIKTRTGEIGQQDVEIARRCLRSDLMQQRLLVAPPIRTDHLQTARTLLVRHGVAEGLRTLDALQLAVALDLRQSGFVDVIVASDQRLCRVATVSGCPAVNPERPGPLLV